MFFIWWNIIFNIFYFYGRKRNVDFFLILIVKVYCEVKYVDIREMLNVINNRYKL